MVSLQILTLPTMLTLTRVLAIPALIAGDHYMSGSERPSSNHRTYMLPLFECFVAFDYHVLRGKGRGSLLSYRACSPRSWTLGSFVDGSVAALLLANSAFLLHIAVWFGTSSSTSPFFTAGIFLAACITDFLDGYLARKMVWSAFAPSGIWLAP